MILRILGWFEKLSVILRTLSLQTLTFEDQLNKLSESVTVSKNELKVFAIVLYSVKNSLLSLSAIFDSPKECLLEKYGLHFFRNGLTYQNDLFSTDYLIF